MAGAALAAVRADAAERRSKLRFPLVAELEYVLRSKTRISNAGRGVTLNISATGVLFRADQRLSVGKPIGLAIEWPVNLEGRIGLKLVARGHTVRVKGPYVAVHFTRYEFRTRRLKDQLSLSTPSRV
jgi:PilZ domain-containing protein